MNQYPKKKFLDTALFAAESASRLIQKTSNRSVKTYKSKTDLVTETDIASEQIISNIIKSKYPDHSILAEESGLNQVDHAEYIWVIDPLDGTTNFVHNYPSYAVSIALVHKNKPIVGVVVEMPAMNTYWATDDSVSYCNNKVIKVSQTDSLIQSLLVTGFGYSHDSKWNINMNLFKEFTDVTQGVRRLGAAAIDICHAASGTVDGFWEFDLNPWDVAAGVLIAERAGAKVSKINGEKYSIYDDQILISNGIIHKAMINIINKFI